MNRRLLGAVALSFLTVWALQYFTQRKDQPTQVAGQAQSAGAVKAGQFYNAPVQQCWHKEPNREIDFIDTKIDPKQEKSLTVETPRYVAKFSNFGGIVQSLSFKKHKGKFGNNLETVRTDPVNEREEGCFLLALEEKSPYLYQYISQVRENEMQTIVYQAKLDGWLIRKTYVLHDNSYRIDLTLDFEPEKKDVKSLQPRLFFPCPTVPELKENVVSGFVSGDGGGVEFVSSSVELSGVWGVPGIFGSQDKYFAHTIFKDPSNFSQGGYFKKVNKKLFSILEGAAVNEKKSWTLSFYMGPKLLGDLSFVDERLEDLLSFGWLSWLCKVLLRFLELLYSYLGNFGLTIIVLTILLKIPFVPLSITSRKKMEEYQKYQPTLNRIRTKYRHDMKLQQAEILRFHKDHNLSPTTPMVGCLPLLVQLPILFALYRVLSNYVSLYQAPFFGWLVDLSTKDPYYVLPILMGISMLWQQKMAPVADEKQRVMMMFMPIVMTAVFINFPAGLVLYWLTNNLLTLGEDVLRKKVFS
ncbi:membrane protein insertase YidC [Candidatus Babeliales bacterium]|nr:membrane protein insertase YidC [Candidatus Babeliales bacterium]